MRIRQMMNDHVTTIRLGSTLEEAATVLAESLASDLVVVDDEGRFAGVLSEGDILRAIVPKFEELMASSGGLSEAFAVLVEHGREYAHRVIDPFVIREPITVSPDAEATRAASTMVLKNIRRLPVVEDGEVVGTLSRADVCAAVLKP